MKHDRETKLADRRSGLKTRNKVNVLLPWSEATLNERTWLFPNSIEGTSTWHGSDTRKCATVLLVMIAPPLFRR